MFYRLIWEYVTVFKNDVSLCVIVLQTLMEEEKRNKELHTIVESREKEIERVKDLLRGYSFPSVDVLQPIREVEGASADISDLDADQHNPQSVIPGNSHMHRSRSSLGAVNYLHPDPNPTPQLLSFPKKPPHTPFMNNTLQQMPMMMTNSAPDFTCSGRPNPALCQTLAPSFLFNTNILIDATASTPAASTPTAVPTLLVPVENHNQSYPSSNLNCNLLRTYSPSSQSSIDAASPESEATHTSHSSDQYPVAIWWNRTQMKPTVGPVTGTLVGLVNMGLCNSNLNNSGVSSDDTNGNDNCDKNVNIQNHPNSQPMSFNLNQAADSTGQEALCQKQFSLQYPVVPVQYFLAPSDQIPVQ